MQVNCCCYVTQKYDVLIVKNAQNAAFVPERSVLALSVYMDLREKQQNQGVFRIPFQETKAASGSMLQKSR